MQYLLLTHDSVIISNFMVNSKIYFYTTDVYLGMTGEFYPKDKKLKASL